MLKNLMNIMTKSMFKGDISCLGNSVLCIDIYEKIFWNENHDLLYELKVSNSHDVTLKTKISTVNAPGTILLRPCRKFLIERYHRSEQSF